MVEQNLDILWPAFLTGLLVLATHVPLGKLVLERGIVFIDLAIAQVASLGVVAIDFVGWDGGLAVQLAAVAAALSAALLFIWTERRLAELQEAMIGVVFVAAAAAEIILLSFNPHGAEHFKDLLAGQILWVTPEQLVSLAVLYTPVVAICAAFDLVRRRLLFYGVFAIAVTASVQLVGVFLVFASLIIPVLAARVAGTRRLLAGAYAVGVTGYLLGLAGSALFDLPTGAAIVCALAAMLAATLALGVARGKWRR
jgi:zinc/manganese transport system permease protein